MIPAGGGEDRNVSRVLVLEPNDDVRALFVRQLRRLGHEPFIDIEVSGKVDVVLLDPSSPAARSILKEARARQPDVYVVCASVYPREDAKALAPNVFLPKPVSIAALRNALPE
jgi:CheY-like chemotaxis protein